MPKRRRLSVNEYAEVDALDHMEVLSPILIRRNMQTHHPVNYQLNHHSLNHPLNSSLINSFNHGHPNFSINTSQQLNQSSPIIFHPSAQQNSNLQTNQQQSSQQRQSTVLHSNGIIELVDNNLQNQLTNTRFNQRNHQLLNHLNTTNEICNCNSQHCLNSYCNQAAQNSQANSVLVNQLNQLNQLTQLNNSLNGNTNTINCNSINQNSNNNYQRISQQQSSPRLSPSRPRFNRNNRWSRYLNNNYQSNSHSNQSNNHPIIHTNRPNTLVYSPTIQSPLSPLINNLQANNNILLANQQQQQVQQQQQQTNHNNNLFNNHGQQSNGLDNTIYTNDSCSNSNSLNNLNNLVNLTNLTNSNQGTSLNQYHNRRFNNNSINNVQTRSNRQRSTNQSNLNAFNLLNTPFIQNHYQQSLQPPPQSNLVQITNSNHVHHQNGQNNYFVNTANNMINNRHLQLINLIQNIPILNPIISYNFNLISQLNSNQLNNVTNTNGNHYQLPTHYSNQYFHHNNLSNQNQATNSNSNSNSLTNALQQRENYDALINLAHRLGETKTRGLTKEQINQLPSYKYKYSTPCTHHKQSINKSFKHNSSSKQQHNQTINNKSTSNLNTSSKLCNKHYNRLDNNHNLLNNSEEEDLFDELDDLDNNDKLLKDDKLTNCKRTKCIGKLNDDELEECCESFICDQDDDEKMICVICMCDFEIKQILRILPCSHEFHARCIDKWLKSNRTCPICRYDSGINNHNNSAKVMVD